jgi:hypothetical protein
MRKIIKNNLMLSRLPVGSRIEACSNRQKFTSSVEEP